MTPENLTNFNKREESHPIRGGGGNENWADRYRGVLPHLERKRFRLQPDELWRHRFHAVRDAVVAYQKQHPELIALNFYGSATKGYATPSSDIDAIVFLDGKRVDDADRIYLERTGTIDLNEKLKADIQKGLGDDQPELSFTVRILDQDHTNNVLEGLLRAIEERGSSGLDMGNFVPYFGQKCERLGEIFTGISVGGGIVEYRKAFLEKLLSRGNAGQVLWKEISGYIRKKERPILRPGFEDAAVRGGKYENLYPQTLEQAIKHFVEGKQRLKERILPTN